ncbi:acyl-CoA dehydrogenase [Asanoa iriomotensis]|uniref:Acyl-CoA dehydrogenase n=1 Tax=Asanoa iriomotensis TaxID=234613 RepID=A0ABQ4C3Z0_9ACTN|nr:acyl-CoA dehydrogenase [Asanoa iriomotensis]GIF57493.1 acyl-CoA dehydrogenase [Asanoa iriomotensis]
MAVAAVNPRAEQEKLLAGALESWTRRHAGPERPRTALAGGQVADPLRDLAERGFLAAHLPEPVGEGGEPLDLAIVAEHLGAALTTGAYFAGLLATLALADHLDHPLASEVCTEIGAGRSTVAVAVDGAAQLTPAPDGDLLVRGELPLLLGPVDADLFLVRAVAGDEPAQAQWLLLRRGEVATGPLPAFDGARPMSTGTVDARLGRDRLLPSGLSASVADALGLLCAAEAAGTVDWCTRTAAAHAIAREQFGRPIGAFQAVKHKCADLLVQRETVKALVWEAARSWHAPHRAVAVAAAATLAPDVAVAGAGSCLQILGGIGFTWEHDAHLHLRRAVVNQRLAATRDRAAELGRRCLTDGLPAPASGGGEVGEQTRAAIRRCTGVAPERQRAALAAEGLVAPELPPPWGLGAEPHQAPQIATAMRENGIEPPELGIARWILPVLLDGAATVERDRMIAAILAGEEQWCQLFSEPGAGSDLASLSTRAMRVEGGWRLHGQKVWTSRAHAATWGFCLARTGGGPRHRGISCFAVPMSEPGVEVRPLRQITGEARFNEVFLDGVFVPDSLLLGEVDGGWRLVRLSLAAERTAMSTMAFADGGFDRVLATARAADLDLTSIGRLGRLAAAEYAVRALGARAAHARREGASGPDPTVRKLVSVGHRQDTAAFGLDLLGSAGLGDGVDARHWQHAFLETRGLSIGGGTSEIMRNVIGERLLGLPRDLP